MATKEARGATEPAETQPAINGVVTGDDDESGPDMLRQITLAAEQCFRKYGVHRTRMEDVAKLVGLVRPNLYRYFPSKQAILLRVLLEHTERTDAERRRRIPLQGPVGDIITNSIVLGWKLSLEDEFVSEMTSTDNSGIAAQLMGNNTTDEDQLPRPAYWDPIFDYGIERGELPPDLPYPMTRRWFGSISLLLTEHRELFPDEDRVRTYVSRFVTPAILRNPTTSGEAPR